MLRVGLRAKLIFSFIALAVLMIGLMVYDFSAQAKRAESSLIDDQMRTAQAAATLIDTSIDHALSLARLYSDDPTVLAFDLSRINPHLLQLGSLFREYDGFALFDAQGNRLRLAGADTYVDRVNVAGSGWFRQLPETRQPVVGDLALLSESDRVVVPVSAPILDPAGGLLGVVSVSIDLRQLANTLGSMGRQPGQTLLVTDRTGRLAFHTGKADIAWEQRDISSSAPIKATLDGRSYSGEAADPVMGDVRLVAATASEKYRWVVAVSLPKDAVAAEVRGHLASHVFVYPGAFLISGLLVALVLARIVLKPIEILTQQISRFGNGELGRRVVLKTGDELERLGAVFNEMAARIEELVQAAEQKASEFQAVISNIADGVYVCDAQGNMTWVNDAGTRIFGVSDRAKMPCRIEDCGKLLQFRHSDGRPMDETEFPLARALRGETFTGLELLYRNPKLGCDMYVQVSGSPIRDNRGNITGAVTVASDISERVRVGKLKDEFLSITAHELRTPLTAVKGYAQLALRHLNGDAGKQDVAGHLRKVIGQVDSLVVMINRLLDISRIQMGRLVLEKRPFDIIALAREVVERLQVTTIKHTLRLFASEKSMLVNGDPSRIEQVLTNLLSNAIKYSPKGGCVDVAITKQDAKVSVSVRDYGVGIPADKQARIFERFYRAEANNAKGTSGTGLGLYVCRGIVEAHRGEISFESKEGQGSLFSFTIPLSAEDSRND